MERLIVKNFGPLKDVDIELNKINLFIGENGSGKSVLAKLIIIVFNSSFYGSDKKKFLKFFMDYGIDYIQEDTYIQYKVNNIVVCSLEKKNIQLVEMRGLSLLAQYIPAERNLISLFSKSLSTLLVEDIPLPKLLLHFSSEYEKARNKIRELTFLNVKYVNADNDRIYYTENEYLDLEHSSSGIQSALPLYVTVKYFAQKHKNIIIEEPEENLFPKAQAETIKYIIEQVSDENSLFMMTHSPYVLSTLNILMMAHKVGNLNEEVKEKVEALIPESQWMNRDNFSAYYLKDGEARDIKGRTGLISDNEIDEVSDDIEFEFEELLTIYREHKNDK
ncbi:MAG: Unknown protein [uncultured Sulfurovum sp.]|uniref:Endonuclease GajA/Old nuclease/RecF-like AAA domain-containing protein n=1 Tax=uncultured Sulfurovum sp. TaxID=269237 RepID=A0A6S6TIU5_9BACT|nr:MAG: Unknown protein [uncultured Sulfurovum sp.]